MKKSVLTWIALLAATGLIFTVACEREKPTDVEKKILKIGCITILSGQVATYGKETKQVATYDNRLKIENDYNSSVVLTRLDLNCFIVKQYDYPLETNPLRLYDC